MSYGYGGGGYGGPPTHGGDGYGGPPPVGGSDPGGQPRRMGSQAPPGGFPGGGMPGGPGDGGDEYTQQMGRHFAMGDARRTGSLDIAGLERALQAAGLNLNTSICGLLLRMHDSDRSETVDFNEFMIINQFIRSVEVSTCEPV